MQPCGGPQQGSGWRLARWLVGADQRPQARVVEPVDETSLDRVGGDAQLGEDTPEAVLHTVGHQPLADLGDSTRVVRPINLPFTGPRRNEILPHCGTALHSVGPVVAESIVIRQAA